MLVATAGVTITTGTASAQGVPADTVFDVSPSLAIEAARTRLRLFTNDNPESPEGAIPADLPECPLVSAESLAAVAATVAGDQQADLRLQSDPWLGRTTSDPELRPDFATEGEVLGIPIVRCDATRPADGQATRPGLFAINLTGGVTFGDVIRLNALEGVLPARPAEIDGQLVGSCLATADTSVCVVLWSSRSLVLGLELEGPPTGVSTATAGTMLTRTVQPVVDTLAVVIQPAPVCSNAAIAADTGVTLLEGPQCDAGWAIGLATQCPSDTGCDAVEVFHAEPDGWVYDGLVDIACTETLTQLGMTVVTASQIAPEPCDEDDPSLDTGAIRPDRQGSRVAALQIALVNVGYDLPVDGRYGPLTESAVVDFQIRNGLFVDGIAGRQTRGALGI